MVVCGEACFLALVVEARDVDKHPKMHRIASNKKVSGLKMSIVLNENEFSTSVE